MVINGSIFHLQHLFTSKASLILFAFQYSIHKRAMYYDNPFIKRTKLNPVVLPDILGVGGLEGELLGPHRHQREGLRERLTAPRN